ncbi:MAG: amino acid adenylation domain-containing protein, partial [Acidobacteria bacterium]|nr:amino acid adenylation domain-containing protein [Acidobacteriota bacterium]
RTPDAVALVFEGRQLTYRELNSRANQLARYLKKQGAGPESIVGICMERSLEMVIALYAALKAGAAYVPIDPEYPADRIAFMLEDAQAPIILTQEPFREKLKSASAIVICLDTENAAIENESEQLPQSGVTAENAAYMIYTSGSTGKPKGVINTHRGIINRLLWMQDEYRLMSGDAVMQKTPFGFDVSVWEFFWPLIAGARLIIAKPQGHRDSRYLIDLIAEEQITTIHFVPSMLRIFLQDPDVQTCRSLKRVLCSGEALPADLQNAFFKRLPAVTLHNLYGPTEAAVDVTSWDCRPNFDEQIVPIGRPIANIRIYILDKTLQPVPVGVPGELHIGGIGVARGYHNRPELTAEKFIADPFSRDPGARLYKTGDLARYRADGNIEYLGRMDFQVKIRGFRIELEEIEATLGQHPGLGAVAVVAKEDMPGEKYLAAYLTPATKEAEIPAVTELRSFLRQKLPGYMIPSVFITLSAMKLTSSGKVDRRALPEPDRLRPELQEGYVAPRTPIEEALAAIWSEVLGVERIGIHNNFFELGGHSLMATRAVSYVRNVFKTDLPLQRLFESPTIAGLAEYIRFALNEGRQAYTPALVAVSREETLSLSFAQQRLWFLEQWNPGSPVYNIPLIFRVLGQLNYSILEQSINEIVRRHEALRTTFAEEQGQPVQRIEDGDAWKLTVIDLSPLPVEEQKSEVCRLTAEGARRPFNLTQWPLFRASVLHLSEQEHVLVLVMHHIVTDGWSHGVFLRELRRLYEAFSRDEPSPLPPLPIQYADYTVWQRQWLQGESLERELQYWKNQLHGLAMLELPTDHPRPPIQGYQGSRRPFILPSSLVQSLKDLSRREGTTLFMTLLAAFQTQLHRYSGQSDIAVGSPIANRSRAELEGLIGFFVNTLVLRSNLEGNPAFRELLSRVREVALGAYAHQDLPFEKLVEELKPERDPGRNPLFQVMMVLQNASDIALNLPGLIIEPIREDTATAKFDLTLELEESPEGIAGSFEYNTDLFDAPTIDRM